MGSNIDQDALLEMSKKIDLLSYASQTMEFHQHGQAYFTSCPLHSDSDPSLCITPDKNLFYCHSCHKGGGIINWMMTYEGLKFNEAVDKVAKLTGSDISHLKICDSLKYYKELNRIAKEKASTVSFEREILPDSYLDQFAKETPQEWVDEGISSEVMTEYGIVIDKASNRICYPIYDNDDNLIGMKGRTRFPNYKALKIKKYQNYTSIKHGDFFVGMHENRSEIIPAKSVFIFEGIKSGLKLTSWGEGRNWLAAETSRLNESQIKILLKLHLNEVIIAFDRDVNFADIKKCTSLLKRFCNVYVVRDHYNTNRLLPGDKDSPVDAGKAVWKTLLSEKIRI